MNSRSVEIYNQFRAASEKFDYFICGASGALFAYITQTYLPQKLGGVISAMMPLAILLLAVSFVCGIKRIEMCNILMKLNHSLLDANERAGNLTEVLAGPPSQSGLYFNKDDGKFRSRDTMEKMRQKYMELAKKLNSDFESRKPKAKRYYKARDIFLILGFCAIFFGKILQPYQTEVFPQKPIVVEMASPNQPLSLPTSTPPTIQTEPQKSNSSNIKPKQ